MIYHAPLKAQEQVVQLGAKVNEGFAAVADGVFVLGGQLGDGLVEFGQEEMGIVAEAASAARLVDDAAFEFSIGGGEDVVAVGKDEDAMVARCAFLGRDIAEGGDELGIVGGVTDFPALIFDALIEVCGVHAGLAAKGVDLQTRVVGQGPHAGLL